ncbi:MAG: FHA domain-containing protein [Bryobacterales bacterium]|nr:FHA domain-containing protein [Bryobacterales bacterium]
MIRCSEGHFYDPAKHNACPWCAKPLDLGGTAGPDPAAGKTTPVQARETAPEPVPMTPGAPAAAPGVTKRVAPKELGIDPVVGWLVCVEGADKGRDYRIHTERNFIGRAQHMDICVSGDDSISRERHAILSFDPKKKQFWIQPGESTGLVYLNGDAVYVPMELKDRDLVELGQTKLMFLAFVNSGFQWR